MSRRTHHPHSHHGPAEVRHTDEALHGDCEHLDFPCVQLVYGGISAAAAQKHVDDRRRTMSDLLRQGLPATFDEEQTMAEQAYVAAGIFAQKLEAVEASTPAGKKAASSSFSARFPSPPSGGGGLAKAVSPPSALKFKKGRSPPLADCAGPAGSCCPLLASPPLKRSRSRGPVMFFSPVSSPEPGMYCLPALNYCLPSTVCPQLFALNCSPSTVCPQLMSLDSDDNGV